MLKSFAVLFFTYTCAVLSQHLGLFIDKQPREWFVWASIFFFLGLSTLVKNWEFKNTYLTILGFSALSLIFASIFKTSAIASLITNGLVAKALPVAGWAYVNQMTHPEIAKRKYFLLHFLVGLFIIPLSFLPQLSFAHSPLYLLSLVCGGLMCLLWAAVLGIYESHRERDETTQLNWITILSLALIFSGIQIILTMNQPIMSQKVLSLASAKGPDGYIASMKQASYLIGSITFFLALISVWIGPLTLKRRTWSFGVASGLLIAAIGLIVSYSWENLFVLSSYGAFLGGIHFFWMFPLVQIAFCQGSLKRQFTIQALVCLVVSPLLEQLFLLFSPGQKGAIFLSLTVLALMNFYRLIDHVKTTTR